MTYGKSGLTEFFKREAEKKKQARRKEIFWLIVQATGVGLLTWIGIIIGLSL